MRFLRLFALSAPFMGLITFLLVMMGAGIPTKTPGGATLTTALFFSCIYAASAWILQIVMKIGNLQRGFKIILAAFNFVFIILLLFPSLLPPSRI